MSLFRKVLICLFMIPVVAWGQINTDRVMMMGRNALYYEDYVLSIQRFNMVISAKPFLSEPYFFRGLAKFYLEDFTGAEADCSKAIERNPFVSNSYQLRGLCRVNTKQYTEAAADYRKVIELEPRNKSAWHNLSLCYIETKAFDEAKESLDEMIRFWPKDAEVYTIKAQVFLQEADTLRAVACIDKALEVNPYEGQAWNMRSMISLQAGRYEDAENELNKAMLQMPRASGLYVNRALARYHQKNLRGAMSDYDAAIEMDSTSYLAHFNRGLLRAQVGDDNRGIEDFNFVLNREPDNMIALFNRALLLENTGDYVGAVRDITAVIDAYPEFWTGYQYRAEIRRKLGDTNGAERDEFTVMKATMDRRNGRKQQQTAQTSTRKQSARDIEEYDKLVVADADEAEHEYESVYRGRVQDKKTTMDPEPLFVLTYYASASGVKRSYTYQAQVERLNQSGLLFRRLYVACGEKTLDEGAINLHFDAIREYTERLSQHPEDALLYLARAIEYYVVHDLSAAFEDVERSITLDNQSPLAYFLRAQIRFRQLPPETIDGTFVNEMDIRPSSFDRKVAYEAMLDDYMRVLQLVPDFYYATYNIGTIRMLTQRNELAVESFTQALQQDSNMAEAYYNRGLVYIKMGDIRKGVADLSKAGELGLYTAYNLIKRYSGETGKK